jgi:transcriptional regulator with XRE-family HTH domain
MSKSEQSDEWRTRLREAVDRTGKKHSAVARDAGIHPETLSRVLTDGMTRPSFEVVVRIAHATGESVGWLLAEPGYALSNEQRELLRRAAATIRKVTGDDTASGG